MRPDLIARDMRARGLAAAMDRLHQYHGGLDHGPGGLVWLRVWTVGTRATREELDLLQLIGAERVGASCWEAINPARVKLRNYDCQESGIIAVADVLRGHGFEVRYYSRVDVDCRLFAI